MREVDDKIIYALNATIPTASFKGQIDGSSTCKHLFSQLNIAHGERDEAIKKCILQSANRVKNLKDERDLKKDDIGINKHFKTEQRKVGSGLTVIQRF